MVGCVSVRFTLFIGLPLLGKKEVVYFDFSM